jgi:hypothetical protein
MLLKPCLMLMDKRILMLITYNHFRLGWKRLSGTDTVAYCAHLKVPKKIKYFEYSPWSYLQASIRLFYPY